MNAVMSLNDTRTKELLTEVMVDLIKNKRDVLHEIMLEALEEVGLANAIMEGRENDFVSEDEIFSILNGANE
jgi:vacuolar-type H+-ATPase subunit D/Vma8